MKQSLLPDNRALFLTRLEGVLKNLVQAPPIYVGGKQPGKDEIDAIAAAMQTADLWLRSLKPYNSADFPEISQEISAETTALVNTFNGIAEQRKGNQPFDNQKRDNALIVLNKIATTFEGILTARREAFNTQPLRRDKP
jgi:hypothetical protein